MKLIEIGIHNLYILFLAYRDRNGPKEDQKIARWLDEKQQQQYSYLLLNTNGTRRGLEDYQ